MIRVYSLVIFSFISFNLTFPQTNDSSPLQGELLLSFNGAVTVPKTDFFTTIPAPMGIGSVEYFFDIKSRNSLGLRFYGGIGTLEGADDNRIPEKYSDGIFFFGSGLTYGYAINNKLVPYLFFGISNIWYNPTDNNGNAILTGKPVSENLSAVTYNYETGVKIFLSSTSTLNIGAGRIIWTA
jgi:hypothetical protein